jgi:hypothetical protein
MMDDMTVDPAPRIASHCASKFGGLTSPASAETNPEIELKAAVSPCTNVCHPFVDRVWLRQERALRVRQHWRPRWRARQDMRLPLAQSRSALVDCAFRKVLRRKRRLDGVTCR